MKIIALGDTHGRDNWKYIAGSNEFDKIVFLGDYFDSHDFVSAEIQINNFREIIEFKESFKEKVILLLGNHDFHYLEPGYHKYTGFQAEYEAEISGLLNKAINKKYIQVSFAWEQILYTHAGVTKTWCRENNIDMSDLESSLNNTFSGNPEAFMFVDDPFTDPSGNDIRQSPIWVRPDSLLEDKIDNYLQVVGHTQQERLDIIDNIAFIDTLGISGEYLIIEGDLLRAELSERPR